MLREEKGDQELMEKTELKRERENLESRENKKKLLKKSPLLRRPPSRKKLKRLPNVRQGEEEELVRDSSDWNYDTYHYELSFYYNALSTLINV